MIWKQAITLDILNKFSKNTLVEHLGIEFVAFGDNYLSARMPVDDRTVQPFRLLHGGASAALAETLGSVGGMLTLEDISIESVVGIELNANHLKGVRSGFVTGTVKPIKIGRTIQVWNIEIKDDSENLICVSRLTLAVIKTTK